jgi:hypothetical protein
VVVLVEVGDEGPPDEGEKDAVKTILGKMFFKMF